VVHNLSVSPLFEGFQSTKMEGRSAA
jgi:hypothetical protein